MQGIKQIGCII